MSHLLEPRRGATMVAVAASRKADRTEPRGDVPQAIREQGISVILPAYNEERAIASSIDQVQETLESLDVPFEILVVDDGSQDRTAAIAEEHEVKVLRHRANRGYGASLKTGIRTAQYGWIV